MTISAMRAFIDQKYGSPTAHKMPEQCCERVFGGCTCPKTASPNLLGGKRFAVYVATPQLVHQPWHVAHAWPP